jgi:sugar O-acyltransferase (sialic acid O-acetyltransferase NeuD family)
VAVQRIVIIGAGGFGREVCDVVVALNEVATQRIDILGFLDDGEPDARVLEPYGIRHLGPVSVLDGLDPDVGYVIGIGNPAVRRQIDQRYAELRPSPVLMHPSATHAIAVTVGGGSVICAGVRITNNVVLGRHVHLNLNSTVGHDARLADYVTVSPLVAISGYVTLEAEVMVGTGATFNPGVVVGRGSVIGSGAAVLKDVPAGVTAVGVPARVR